MPIIGFKCIDTGKDISFDECLTCALSYENKCHFTAEILRGIIEETTEARDTISVTRLIGCQRLVYLLNNYDVFISPEKLYWAFRGTLAHSIIEKYKSDPTTILETRFKRKVGDTTISGRPDIIIPGKKLIRDYKTTSEITYYTKVWSHHEAQLNIYRWLIQEKYEIDRLEVVYMDMKRVKICPVKNIWELSECERFVEEKASILVEAFKNKIPPITPEEFPLYWQCRDYCECNHICARLFKEEIKKDFDAFTNKELFDVDTKSRKLSGKK